MEHDSATNYLSLRVYASEELYRRVRAGFIGRGDSLNAFCRREGIYRQNARACLIGVWQGPAAETLRERLAEAAGVA